MQRLELNWIGKDERPRLEPRILLEDVSKSYHAAERVSDGDIFDNRLIFGDNLLALKALESGFTGNVKCVFIDPPYNTGSAFEHYDDGVEHSLWLSLMRDRIDVIRRLLSSAGSLWITIDDNECHYLKVLCDEIFGRDNFVTSIAWQMIYTTKNSARYFSTMHDHILVYAKYKPNFTVNLLPRDIKQDEAYKNLDNDRRGPWKATPLHARNYYGAGQYTITAPSGREIKPPSGTYWRLSEQSFKDMEAENRVWWGRSGDAVPSQKRFLTDVKQGLVPSTFWTHLDSGHNGEAKNEIRALLENQGETFLTPKPERLVKRIIEIATLPGDLVLDSFAGSGTTGAVAHKMGRRWIMVELGEQCQTHIVPRLQKVIDGEDKGGITEAVSWKGGGGFRYFRLAPSLLTKDCFENWVITPSYNAAMLAEAVCKLMGFAYAPSQEPAEYWLHGYSTETDFIYVTTQSLTYDALKKLSDEVGSKRTLLVCCKAWSGSDQTLENLTIKKIPQAVLKRCEWGRDDYSLKVADLPATIAANDVTVADAPTAGNAATSKRRGRSIRIAGADPSLFAADTANDE